MAARIISGTHAPASTILLWSVVILVSARCSVQGQVVAGRRVAAVAAPARDPADQTTPLDNSGLHIKAAGRVNFGTGYHIMNDGGGYRWDIQYCGNVYRGTPYAYSGGMYCQIGGTNFQAPARSGWVNKARDEIELGPWSRKGLKVYRRIKVYKGRPLARWVDIFENPTGSSITVQVAIYINTRYTIRQTTTDTGGRSFGAKDTAFRTITSSSRSVPVLHVVTSKRAKLRPAVQIRSSRIYLRYNLTVPARKTLALCHFESQNRSATEHAKLMKKFPLRELLKDLSPSLRARILNMAAGGGFGGIDLVRSEGSDAIMLKSGDPVFGSIRNKSFEVVTLWGNLHLQAKEVVGMAGGKGGQVRFALLDGQVVSGKANDGVLNVMLGQSGRLRIPFEKISQWSYRITKERPRDNKYTGAYVALRTGDRLAFDAEKLDIRFRTRHGVIDLSPGHLLEITLDNRGNGVHRVAFRNGSRLAGFLEPESLRFVLKSGRKVAISRNLLVRMRFVAEGEGDGTLTRVLLSNGDKLFGQLAADKFKLTTDYGQIDISRNRVKSIQFHPQDLGRTVVHTWKGSVLKGRMRRSPLGFQIAPGTKLRIHAGHLVSLVRPLALPLETARRQIEILVAQLGAESYKDRQAATKALVAMGKSILPILRKQLSSKDPEVNHRISLILEQLSTASSSPPTVVPHPARHIMLKGRGG